MPKRPKFRVYLAGPISGCNDDQMHRWRDQLKKDYGRDFEFIDPTGQLLRDGQASPYAILQEAKVASALDHPNICTIFEINETPDGQLYLVMAHYEGETLKERIERHRDLHMSLCSFLVSSGSSCHRAVRTRAVAVMVLLLALLPSGLLAQPPPQRPTFRAGIDLIEIDVTVVNGQGVPVKDLRAPEFTVSVDGQPRSVVTAEFIDLRAETAEGRPASADAGEGFYSSNTAATRGRLIVLMIDRENMTFGAGSKPPTMRERNHSNSEPSPTV